MIFATIVFALLDVSIHGDVRSAGSREPIASAVIEVVETGRTVRADPHGYFVLPDLKAGRWRIRASAPGHRSAEKTVQLPSGGSIRMDFELTAQTVEVEGLEVRVRQGSSLTADAGPGAAHLDRDLINATPALAEVDVLRAVQTLPAVAAASDFSSALYVRGGSPDQTLVMLDDVPLFNPYHLGGIFGAIDPDAVASVDLVAGALPARVGDRISGIVNIRTRSGGRDRVRGNGSVGLISARSGVDGPLPGGRGSYLFSARRTYLDLATGAAHGLGLLSYTVPYAFTDAHLKLTHDVGRSGSLIASLYLNDEGLHAPEQMDLGRVMDWSWGSRAAGLSYRQPFGAALLGSFRAAASTFGGSFLSHPPGNLHTGEGRTDHTLDARTSLRDLLLGLDLTWYRRTHQLRAGLQWDSYAIHHDVRVTDESLGDFFPSFAREGRPSTLAVYLEDEWAPAGALRLRAGMRVLHGGGSGTAWMPRIGARLALSPALALSAGGGRYAQALYSMKDEESVFSSLMAYDVFAAVPAGLGLATGEDLLAGVEWVKGVSSVRFDAYGKRMDQLPLPPLAPDPLFAPVLAPEGVRAGEGSARGLEVLGRHAAGAAAFSISYALAAVERTVDGDRFPPRFERRHRVDLTSHAGFGKSGRASVRVTWATGQPYTPVVGKLQAPRLDPRAGGMVPGEQATVLGEHNSARLPGYFRLDVGVRKSFDRTWFGRSTTLTPYLQVLNAMNTPNALFAEPDPYGEQRHPELRFAPQLPLLPTFGLEWRF